MGRNGNLSTNNSSNFVECLIKSPKSGVTAAINNSGLSTTNISSMTNPLSKMSNSEGGFYCHSMINDNKHKTIERINYNTPLDNLSS